MEGYRFRTSYSTLREARTEDKPRERLERLGPEALTDEELLMLIIGSGTSSRPVDEIARDLLSRLDRSPEMHAEEMMQVPGFLSIHFSGNMGVIKTRPGYASSIAYNIDASGIPHILGTIAGDDTIFIVIKEGIQQRDVVSALSAVVPEMARTGV